MHDIKYGNMNRNVVIFIDAIPFRFISVCSHIFCFAYNFSQISCSPKEKNVEEK